MNQSISTTGIEELLKPTGDLPPCIIDISTGNEVAWLCGPSAKLIDRFVRELAEHCGEVVDWHFVGGRARILTLGDAEKVREIMENMLIRILL